MTQIIVGISDCRVSADPSASLVTYALGSCIGVMVYDPGQKVGGMLHFMLPDSALDQVKAASNPFMFADTGIPLLFAGVCAQGAAIKQLRVRLAGGAQVLDPQNVFAIGKRNYLAARKALWKLGAFVESEAVGGDISRTIRLELATGKSWLREGAQTEVEFGSTAAGCITSGAVLGLRFNPSSGVSL